MFLSGPGWTLLLCLTIIRPNTHWKMSASIHNITRVCGRYHLHVGDQAGRFPTQGSRNTNTCGYVGIVAKGKEVASDVPSVGNLFT